MNPTNWQALKVLIADDQRFMLNILTRILRDLGVAPGNIHQASNGTAAAEVLARTAIHIAVCDIAMGPGNGLALLKSIRMGDTGAPPDLPFIFITGHSDSATVRAALRLDASGFIIKPVAPRDLQAKIVHALASPPSASSPKDYSGIPVSLSRAILDHAAIHGYDIGEERARPAGAERSGSMQDSDTERIPLWQIKEDDTLAYDISREGGTVLVRAGTLMTREIIDRLLKVGDELAKSEIVVVRRHQADAPGEN